MQGFADRSEDGKTRRIEGLAGSFAGSLKIYSR
jgi:hypothetical protein